MNKYFNVLKKKIKRTKAQIQITLKKSPNLQLSLGQLPIPSTLEVQVCTGSHRKAEWRDILYRRSNMTSSCKEEPQRLNQHFHSIQPSEN
jgi:hypothetical protein